MGQISSVPSGDKDDYTKRISDDFKEFLKENSQKLQHQENKPSQVPTDDKNVIVINEPNPQGGDKGSKASSVSKQITQSPVSTKEHHSLSPSPAQNKESSVVSSVNSEFSINSKKSFFGRILQPMPAFEKTQGKNVEEDIFKGERSATKKLNIKDHQFYRTVGTGSFGRVMVVKNKKSNRFYAVKILNKAQIVKTKQVGHLNTERAVLAFCDCPFIVNIYGTGQDSKNLYMFMEYVSGGEVFTYLRKYKRFPSPVAKFYAAEVLVAFEYLHSHDIIYRDLKPENLLIDRKGHIKLTDLGFAKYVPDITWTLCGTPDYLAPEIIQAKGYGKSVDWYSLGVLIFEMIAGYPPFYEDDHYKLYERILANKIQWPSKFDKVAADLVKKLVTPDLTKRYGNLQNGSRDISSHRWFAEVNWNKLARKEISAPLIPPTKKEGDTSNFDKYPESNEKYGDTKNFDPYSALFEDF
ncbi:hypothetical protein BB558_001970 [Smittium angustum]|uniref:cAMP-dependent protein kinase n=1 Tax=Smittium angustum TaxID=133377 RepID=A0A2U1JA59_SMIAN|nr:hypothetical protein BB558_001970 [Smittium angustum]